MAPRRAPATCARWPTSDVEAAQRSGAPRASSSRYCDATGVTSTTPPQAEHASGTRAECVFVGPYRAPAAPLPP